MIEPKYIFIVGGVMSGVGKGVTAASIGAILQAKGFCVTAIKADPYINVDAGTMNPTVHGEVFVLDDGDETDQDMGNYERFLNVSLTSTNYMTTGRVYQTVIENERAMKYGGKCVEVVPHIPEEIIRRIKEAQKKNKADITIIEIGGTLGEYQNILFLEAARMMKLKNPSDVAFVLVSYLPVPSHIGEMKTKPTQHAARTLNSAGIQADIIVARGRYEVDKPRREKLAVFCGVRPENCISAPDVDSIYKIPLKLDEQDFGNKILDILHLSRRKSNLADWKRLVVKIGKSNKKIKIAVVGKYFGTGDFTLADSYISVIEAAKHASWTNGVIPELTWVDSEEFEKYPVKVKELKAYDGIIVPGGFGTRGIEGIISSIKFARENNIPYLGLCYGMELACIEFARHVVGITEAHTVEVDEKTKEPVIDVMAEQKKNLRKNRYGGTMRLGAYSCLLASGTRAAEAYKKTKDFDLKKVKGGFEISERHRHRYEFNNAYKEQFEKAGMVFPGINKERDLVEIMELPSHPFFMGSQFHPEFQSRPMRPHPLFREFIIAAIKKKPDN